MVRLYIPNKKIFELLADFIPYISAYMWVILIILSERVFLIMMHLFAENV